VGVVGFCEGSLDPSYFQEEDNQGEMYEALVGLYQSRNSNRKLILRHHLRSVEMFSADTVASYHMRITKIRDQLAVIGEAVDDTELVNVGSWEPFVQGICAQDKLPPFEKLWTDCIQEEAQIESRNGKQRGIDDENLALAAHARKGRGNGSWKDTRREASPEQRKKKDLSKVKCFSYHEHGHYASQCPQRKKGSRKQQASSTEVDVVANRLQREFLLVSSLSREVSDGGTWFVDSGVACHTTGARELFERFTESDSNLYVELGMGTKHAVGRSGTVSFQMELGDRLRVTNVLWVPKLRRSVLSVSAIEKKGYEVLFGDGQALFKPKGSSSETTICIG
jgi:hypothetical protein